MVSIFCRKYDSLKIVRLLYHGKKNTFMPFIHEIRQFKSKSGKKHYGSILMRGCYLAFYLKGAEESLRKGHLLSLA